MAIAFAALAVSMEAREEAVGVRLAQTGPVPTSVVNPRLGAPPPGGHLGETLPRPGAVVPNAGGAAGNPGARAGTAVDDRLGRPPVGAVPNAATGAILPPGAAANAPPGAVQPGAGAVPPPAAGAVPPAGR